MYKFQIFLIIFILCLSKTFYSLDTISYAKNLSQHLGLNLIDFNYSNSTGIYCVAMEDLYKGQTTFNIPVEYLITSFDLYPFKFELKDAISEAVFSIFKKKAKKLKIKTEQEITKNSTIEMTNRFLFNYQLMFILHKDKKEINDFLIKNRLSYYLEYSNSDRITKFEEYLYSLPKVTYTEETYDQYDIKFSNLVNVWADEESNLMLSTENEIFQSVMQIIKKNYPKYSKVILPWISDFELFKYAYSLANSRSYTLNLRNYEALHNKTLLYMPMGYKQKEKFSDIYSSKGMILIQLCDLCNHKNFDREGDLNPFEITYTPGSIRFLIHKEFKKNEEYLLSYQFTTSNELLLRNYGFYVEDNPLSFSYFKVKIDKVRFSRNKYDLCITIGCFDQSMPNMNNFYSNDTVLNMTILVPAFQPELNLKILIMFRIMQLSDTELDSGKIINSMIILGKISINNELMALGYYFTEVNKFLQGLKFGFVCNIIITRYLYLGRYHSFFI